MIPSMTVIFIWILLIGYRTIGITSIRNCDSVKSLNKRDEISNSDYSASSFSQDTNGNSFQAFRARADHSKPVTNTAWCPDKTDQNPWLEVNLKTQKIIDILAFGGLNMGYDKKTYTPFYKLQYKRDDHRDWITYKTSDGQEIHQANENNRDWKFKAMRKTTIAKKLRIYPINPAKETVTTCLSLDIQGYDFPDGVLNYEAPVGDKFMTRDMNDIKYNGEVSDDHLQNGVGSLLDCDIISLKKFSVLQSVPNSLLPVAWKNTNKNSISLRFNFDQVYEFKEVHLYTLVSETNFSFFLFKSIEVEFSPGGETFDKSHKLTFSPKIKNGSVTLSLYNNIARSIYMTLFFNKSYRDNYIVLSEVIFDNVPYHKPIPTQIPRNISNAGTKINRMKIPPVDGSTPPNKTSPNSISKEMSSIIAFACLLFGLVICTILGLYFYCKSRRHHHEKSNASMEPNGMIMGGPHLMSMNPYKPYSSQPDTTGYFNSLRAATMTTNLNGNGGVEQARYPLLKDNLYTTVPTDDEDEVASKGSSGRGSAINPYAACSIPRKWCGNVQMPLGAEYASASLFSSPGTNYAPAPEGCIVYQSQNNENSYPTLQMIPAGRGDFVDSRALPPNGMPYTAPFRTLPVPPAPKFPSNINIQGVTGSSVYASPDDLQKQPDPNHTIQTNSTGSSSLSLAELNVPDVNINDLRLLERLGSGHFGEIHLAEYSEPADSMPLISYTSNDESEMARTKTRLVSVKITRTDASNTAKRDLQAETAVLARLNDPNIAQVIGICREQGAFYVVVEHGKHGDLHEFLKNRHLTSGGFSDTLSSSGLSSAFLIPDTIVDVESSMTISYGCLIYMAMQIASGMKYLESLKIVHRDLACRNCLVDSKFSVKITDLGMSRRLYSADYYRSENNSLLPVRWMAWESLLEGRFSTKSDVWAFAVTLWEILTFCRQPPLSQLTDEQVVENLRWISLSSEKDQQQGIHNTNGPGVLPKIEIPQCSSNIPKEIYDLMKECWQKRPEYRPAFSEIHMFLRRKNLGFNADEEYQLSKASAGTVSPMLS